MYQVSTMCRRVLCGRRLLFEADNYLPCERSISLDSSARQHSAKALLSRQQRQRKVVHCQKNGGLYIIECNIDHYGGDSTSVGGTTFESCMDACNAATGCVEPKIYPVDVSWASATFLPEEHAKPGSHSQPSMDWPLGPGCTAIFQLACKLLIHPLFDDRVLFHLVLGPIVNVSASIVFSVVFCRVIHTRWSVLELVAVPIVNSDNIFCLVLRPCY
ncbi:hypothetical protein BU25DRAFT_426609 [Macroventuria anomochaeta]|uniref:Uncharacterized protein n=1 Tax=Macroventuria anomochaeta TaxID=301207 RepID=A0ACB6RHD9_9PLEO|nr:uncharacterized protein BU25DRAFT_426609 [Macroventuria anomochaeta]KAF2621330.1 hypothetical protein BU25DRAFT_426609 [Macroventuria anomochaeta]